MAIDRELVLNMWAADDAVEAIMLATGAQRGTVLKIASEARLLGDRRAKPRSNAGHAIALARGHAALNRIRHLKKMARLPSSDVQIENAIANYTGPVTRVPPGFHAGYVPQCLRALNY